MSSREECQCSFVGLMVKRHSLFGSVGSRFGSVGSSDADAPPGGVGFPAEPPDSFLLARHDLAPTPKRHLSSCRTKRAAISFTKPARSPFGSR